MCSWTAPPYTTLRQQQQQNHSLTCSSTLLHASNHFDDTLQIGLAKVGAGRQAGAIDKEFLGHSAADDLVAGRDRLQVNRFPDWGRFDGLGVERAPICCTLDAKASEQFILDQEFFNAGQKPVDRFDLQSLR